MNSNDIEIRNVLMDFHLEATTIRALLWTADQLFLERNDYRISMNEARDRVSYVINVALERLDRFCDDLENTEASIPSGTMVGQHPVRQPDGAPGALSGCAGA